MNKRMKILLCANSTQEKVGIGINYVSFFSQFGEVILVTSDNDLKDMLKIGDVLALPGGADVNPARYGERPHHKTGSANAQFEYLDEHLLGPWLKTGKPIIGICRGLQTLNVACGGSLWQDLFHHVGGEDRSALDHKLYTRVPGWEVIDVNSYHHQGIKKLAPGFKDIGYSLLAPWCPTTVHNEYFQPKISTKDGRVLKSKAVHSALVEVIQHETKPYVAFQYHPEDYNCPFAIEMITQTLKRYKADFELKKASYESCGYAGGWEQEERQGIKWWI